jgi:peptidoglycan hydrolase-like amidase
VCAEQDLGWSAVRSGRFTFEVEGDTGWVHGAGLGHGLGLCQARAAPHGSSGYLH